MDTSAADLGILMIVDTHTYSWCSLKEENSVCFFVTARMICRIRVVLICLFLSEAACYFVFTGTHCFISRL